MTITQTVEIPADHKVFFEFLAQKEIPAGKARIELKVTPVVEPESSHTPIDEKKRITPLTDALSRILSDLDGLPTPRADRLLGIVSNPGDISLEEIRSERLAKYLK